MFARIACGAALVFVLTALIGCTPRIEYQTLYVYPDDSWLVDCTITPPISPAALNKLPIAKRLNELGKVNLSNYLNLQKCNEEKKAIRLWKADHQRKSQ